MRTADIKALVQKYGGIDAAQKHQTEYGQKAWRAVCKERGVKFERPGFTATARAEVAPESKEAVLAQENAELRRALAVAREGQTRDYRLVSQLMNLIPQKQARYEPADLGDVTGWRPHEFVLLWSDLHAAERVFADQVHGLNEYNWDVMLQRHDKMRKSVLSFKANRPYPIPRLRILGLGDMVSGDIHDELRVTNESVLMEAALQLGLDMSEWVESFVSEFEEITIDGVVGNHGRTSVKPQAKNQHSNFDWMVYHIMKLRLAGYPSVTVNVPKSPFEVVQVMGKQIYMFHGDGIKSTMPGVPWGGVIRRTNELTQTHERTFGRIDHFVLGHFHEPNVTRNKRVIVNGSVKGPDEYSLKYLGGGSDAAQLLLVFNEKYGMTESAYIDLQGRVIA